MRVVVRRVDYDLERTYSSDKAVLRKVYAGNFCTTLKITYYIHHSRLHSRQRFFENVALDVLYREYDMIKIVLLCQLLKADMVLVKPIRLL